MLRNSDDAPALRGPRQAQRMNRWRRRGRGVGPVVGLLAAALLLVAGCTGNMDLNTEDPEPVSSTEAEIRPISRAQEPEAAATLLSSTGAGSLAIAASTTYIDDAAIAVLAPAGDRAAVLRAASIGAAIGAPVLLSGAEDGTLDAELLRLGVVGVLTVGAVDLRRVDTISLVIAPAPSDIDALGELVGADLTEVLLPPTDQEPDASGPADIDALVALEPGSVFAAASERPQGSESDSGQTSAPEPTAVGEFPELAEPKQLTDSVVITDGAAEQVAAVATSLAAGAEVIRSSGDIRGNAEAIAALSEAAPSTVVGIGTTLGDETQFAWQSATAQAGAQLPGGSQLVFDGKRYVALYGSPKTAALGLLGEQDQDATIARAAQFAGLYAPLTQDTVVPALEIIVTVASGSAGEDGNYSNEWPAADFVPLVEAAAAAGQYVVLDFQPGRTSFPDQVKLYEDLLAYPNVGIALDPEWRLTADQFPLRQIGSVSIAEVNAVVTYLADFVQVHRLPQKLMVLHQFQQRMIADRQNLDMSRSELAMLIHVDGQGSQAAKQATWAAIAVGAPEGIYWGWKNFVDEDVPMLTPTQTYAEVQPVPDFVSYQ